MGRHCDYHVVPGWVVTLPLNGDEQIGAGLKATSAHVRDEQTTDKTNMD